MRHQGRITTWHDDKGYGFVSPNGGGARVFVHRSDIESRRRPRGGELVTYELTVDDKRRHNARRVLYVAAARSRGLPAVGAIVAPMVAVVFFASLVSAVLADRLPWAVLAGYAALSVATFALYRADKRAAEHRHWRIPESTLHLLAVAGGWPGALVAQRWLRHKSKKVSFLTSFVITVALNLAALLWFQWGAGAVFLRALLNRG